MSSTATTTSGGGEDLSRKYFQQLISAVDYCHSRGVFYRDPKPENLFLDENWDMKITDFSLCAVTGQTRQDRLLRTLSLKILKKKGYDGAKIDI